jgi:hypothetical protein
MEWKRKVYLSACSFLNTYALAQIRYKSQLIILLYDTIWMQICFVKHNSRLTYIYACPFLKNTYMHVLLPRRTQHLAVDGHIIYHQKNNVVKSLNKFTKTQTR